MKTSFYLLSTFCSFILFISCSEKKELEPQSKTASRPKLETLTVSHSMKGWELYSWPESNTWKFSFLVGTNRRKTLTEVTTGTGVVNLIVITGVDSAKMVLNKFPEDEWITLYSKEHLEKTWANQDRGNLQLPPQTAIEELKAYSVQKKLNFQVTE